MISPVYDKDGITIFNGDCREVLPTLESGSVTLLWTDPPYGHGNQDGDLQAARVRDGVKGARVKPVKPIANDQPDSMREVVHEMLTLAVPILRADCCCCCCCCAGGGGPRVTFAWLANRMDTDGLQFFHSVIWDKSGRGHGLGWRFRRNYEFVMVGHRAGGKLSWSDPDKAEPNILFIPPDDATFHPNPKPVALAEWFIELTTKPGDLILDPFMGSGPTLVAAQNTGRRAIGCEVEPEYVAKAIERLRQGVLAF